MASEPAAALATGTGEATAAEKKGAALHCGIHLSFAVDLGSALQQFVYNGYFAFVLTPLVHPRLRRDGGVVSDRRTTPLTRSDLVLESSAWNTTVIGQVSPWLELDSADAGVRVASEKALREELAWASHLSLAAVAVPCPTEHCFNYASVLRRVLQSSLRLNVWVQLPLCAAAPGDRDPWRAWNTLRVLCDRTHSIGVLLTLTAALPSASALRRWAAEPVKAVVVPTALFVPNKKGFPVLPQAHQAALLGLHGHGAQFILSGRARHAEGFAPYYLYLEHLVARVPAPSVKDGFETPFYDYLQSPLQPLGDHLESQMYETFEKDPVKYARYEEAVALALADSPAGKTSVVMVVGAGRGPLVRAALRAAETAKRSIRVFAVEKNPNAVVTLRNMQRMLGWGEQVTIVHEDMRHWEAPELADILVSELLGSWGDNELSPECLDGAEKFLNPDGGISIPYEYTSFVEPISTGKLWNDCKNFDSAKYFETMYVVKLNAYASLTAGAAAKRCFTFAHPSWHKGKDVAGDEGHETFSPSTAAPDLRDGRIDNSRFRVLDFVAEETAVMHGFAGYFEAKLYKDVMISINPATFSDGMFSWFPIYIPLREPQLVEKGQAIRAVFWRHCTASSVWYEWALETPCTTPIHNVNGESSSISLSS